MKNKQKTPAAQAHQRLKYEPNYKFKATSMAATTTELRPAGEKPPAPPAPPCVWYAAHVWDQMWHIVHACEKEVGWLGLVEEVQDGYLITDIFLPEQIVTGAETDISEDALAELALQLINDGRDTEQLYYWAHSHVDMGVTPSGQDEDQVDEYLKHTPVFIRGIYNKRGQSKVDVFDTTARVVHQCVEDGIYTPGLTATELQDLDALIEQQVTERSYKPSPSKQNLAAIAREDALADIRATHDIGPGIYSYDPTTNRFIKESELNGTPALERRPTLAAPATPASDNVWSRPWARPTH